ncbi:uncharacterized protein LY89DRAFT_680897 [Mollisia scopiformis]|uniref:Uncharacterized protein n=1 Tax=Mollisia scopiformis TaxID=149040 RepID=A0A194XRW6_MOLSC|nr:uncharacterized protein LY89DRAFT_680897 [Mollisia scopiformis]KUJ22794.1 hypothetical protein LY89DRAFT_680897 [Mollisia scopiformis]
MGSRKFEKAPEPAAESEEDNTQPTSPERAIEKAKKLMVKYNINRDAKRKAIEEEYEKHAKDVGRRIDKLSNARKSRVTKSQKALWDRLDVLNKKRQSLENTILMSMKAVETHTLNISSELYAMFEGRIEELQEPSTPEA